MNIPSGLFSACVIERENFVIKEINETFSRLLGYEKNIIGQEYLALVVSEEFSVALQALDSVSQAPLYVAFSLLDKEGQPHRFFHTLVQDGESILDVMMPVPLQQDQHWEHALLKHLTKPVFCLAEDGGVLCANESAKQYLFDGVPQSFLSHPLWGFLQSRWATGKPFSEWLSIGQKEGFFFFHPVENGYWLVEYQWGREEIFQRLSDIILDWEFPAAVIDLRQEIPKGSFWNGGFSSLDGAPDEILSRIKGLQKGEKYLSIPRKNGQLSYYRPLFFPFHPRVEIVLVVLLEETEHVRKTFMVERVQQSLSEMIRLSEEIQQRLSGGLESFFEQYQLSERERKLVKLIQQGLSNEEIASALYVSVDTVKKGISQLYRKLEVNGRLELLQRIFFPFPKKMPPKG